MVIRIAEILRHEVPLDPALILLHYMSFIVQKEHKEFASFLLAAARMFITQNWEVT